MTMNKTTNGAAISWLALAVSAVAFAASPAVAQEADNSADAATEVTDEADTGGLGEIIVTAQRRSESLQKTPIAITALSGEALESRNIQSTQDLMQTTPGLQVSTLTGGSGSGSATFFLRGMGQQRSLNGSEPAVGVYVDDFYYPTLQGSVFSILDLEQVEVLRGPQGTLFGRNTIGGAIRYTSRKPDVRESSVDLKGTLGRFDRHDITGVANIAISDIAAVRITGGRLRSDGFVKQANGGEDAGASATDLVRGQLRVLPTDTLEINISAHYSRNKLDGFPYAHPLTIAPPTGSNPAIWNASPAGLLNPYDNRYQSRCDYCQPGTTEREFADTKAASATGVVEWELSDAITVKSLSSWQKVNTDQYIDLDGSPLPIFDNYREFRTRAYSQELQINGRMIDDRLNWVGGLYYYDQKDSPEVQTSRIQNAVAPLPRIFADTTSKAAFLDASFALNDTFKLLGGIRYSKDSKDAEIRNAAGTVLATASGSFSSTTWRAGIQAQMTPDIMGYATVSTGFRGGGFSPVSTRGFVEFLPETATSYEAGLRLDLLDRRLRINPTVFYTDWKDIQVQAVTVDPVLGVVASLQNAASAHSYGLELEAEAQVTDNFRLFGNLALLRLQYDSVGTANGITIDSKFQRAPRTTYAFGGSYDTDLGGGFELKASSSWSWQGVQYSTPTDSDQLRLPSYGILNARVELNRPDDGIGLALFVTNLTNKVHYVGGVNYSKTAGAAHYDLGRPREWGLTLSYSF